MLNVQKLSKNENARHAPHTSNILPSLLGNTNFVFINKLNENLDFRRHKHVFHVIYLFYLFIQVIRQRKNDGKLCFSSSVY